MCAAAVPGAGGGATRRLRRLLPRGGALSPDVWCARHRSILVLLWVHAIVIPVFALVRGFAPEHVLLESVIVPLAALVAGSTALGVKARTAAASAGLLSSSAILVHLSGGVIEMHFHFFVMVAVVALYQDWLPFLTAIAYVLVHHGVMGALDPDSVYNHAAAQNGPWKWAAIHAFFIAGTSAACLVTWKLNESVLAQRLRAEEENARLYESERAARRSAEDAQARLALLADVSTVLNSSLEVDAILRGVTDLVVPAIADYCAIDLGGEGGGEGGGERGGDGGGEGAGAQRTVASGSQPEGATSVEIPLVGRCAPLGSLTLATTGGARGLRDDRDFRLAEEIARRVAIALENAQLFARQRSVAETLQHALLPERLPQIPGLACAAQYRAGGPDVEVGGDWYEVVQLSDGSIALAIGDVVGRGEKAASLMGQLRTAVRVSALDGKQPREVVGAVNALLLEAGGDHLATLVYGVLSPESGVFRFVNAGHPPPLVLSADRTTAAFLDGTGGIPVGALATARYGEAHVDLEPGAVLLLYTDGLVEERTLSLDVGLASLQEAALSATGGVDELCSHVISRVLGSTSTDDDVAMLAVRIEPLGDRLHLSVPATVSVLAPLRSTLRRWLVRAGASEQEQFELLVAVGEASTNAIRHGSKLPGARFELDATADGEGVVVRVRDHGGWSEPCTRSGGRGLAMIENLVDDLDITRATDGTEVRMRRRLSALEQLSSRR